MLPLEPEDPHRIDSHELLARLGTGGMGTVYLARSSHENLVAIKLVHAHLASDGEFRSRFASEAAAASRVPAFCSAQVLGSGVFEGRPYLITEHIDGVPLSRHVTDNGPLTPADLHALALGTAAGIAAIHSVGLVHRDVKPSNIMLTFGGVRIIDFGIARAMDETHGYTRTGIVMGSLGWAAPEQLEGDKPAPAMDVFAWGCVVGYAATGRHPFGPGGLDTRAQRIMSSDPHLADVPDPLRPLVTSALDRRPARRPTAQELLLALVGAAPPPAVTRQTRFGFHSRHRVAAAAAYSIPLAITLTIAIAAAGAKPLGDAKPGPVTTHQSDSSDIRPYGTGKADASAPSGSPRPGSDNDQRAGATRSGQNPTDPGGNPQPTATGTSASIPQPAATVGGQSPNAGSSPKASKSKVKASTTKSKNK
jgi:serine/threonine protein kinase